MARTAGSKNQDPYVIPDDKLQQREQVYQIYQGMGPLRSIVRLERLLRDKHPTLRVSRPTLEKWSVQHGWAARVSAHDATATLSVQAATGAASVADDPIAALLDLTYKTLARALAAAPQVTRPNEVKSLIDSATTALKLAEQIKASQTSKTPAEDVAAETLRVIDQITARRREDALTLAIDILTSRALTRASSTLSSKEKAMAGYGCLGATLRLGSTRTDQPGCNRDGKRACATIVGETDTGTIRRLRDLGCHRRSCPKEVTLSSGLLRSVRFFSDRDRPYLQQYFPLAVQKARCRSDPARLHNAQQRIVPTQS